MFKSAEDEGGDKKPHIKNLGKRSLFLPDSSDENRERYKQAAEDTKKNQADRESPIFGVTISFTRSRIPASNLVK